MINSATIEELVEADIHNSVASYHKVYGLTIPMSDVSFLRILKTRKFINLFNYIEENIRCKDV